MYLSLYFSSIVHIIYVYIKSVPLNECITHKILAVHFGCSTKEFVVQFMLSMSIYLGDTLYFLEVFSRKACKNVDANKNKIVCQLGW